MCKKSLAWFDENGLTYTEIDIISNPPSKDFLERHIDEGDVKAFLNPRSKPYREHGLKSKDISKSEAIALMIGDPNLIKRPVVVKGNKIGFGFNEEFFKSLT